MTKQPIANAQARKVRQAAFWEETKTEAPDIYIQHLREQQRTLEFERFADSQEGQAIQAKVAAWWEETRVDRERRYAERAGTRAARRLAPEYALLGVQPGASQQAIKKAYHQKARELHPDAGGNDAAMARVNAAYQKLTTKMK